MKKSMDYRILSVANVCLIAAFAGQFAGCRGQTAEPHVTAFVAEDGQTALPEISDSDWPTYNVQGWRYNSAETQLSPQNSAQLELKWRFPPEGSEQQIGVGCKNGCFYVLDASDGMIIASTPMYEGRPQYPLKPKPDPRMIALPSVIGGM